MKVFVTGATGQLGYDVMIELLRRGHEAIGSGGRDLKAFVTGVTGQLGRDCIRNHAAIGSDIAEKYGGATTAAPYVRLDITDKVAVASVIEDMRPDAIIHCAAWTDVDGAENPENKLLAHKINAEGTENIAKAAKSVDAKMVYISTDYVFNGQGTEPWTPDCEDYAPLNYYGQTKLEGEQAVANLLEKYFIVRIAWVFGLNGKNFIKTMIHAGKTHDKVRVVNDQIGTPTYAPDLARLLADMIETEKYGRYHATNEGGYISWYDFCVEFYKQYGLSATVIPVTTEEYGLSIATRPFNSKLDKSKLIRSGFTPLPDWRDAVKRYLTEAEL